MLDALEWPLTVSNYIQFENKFSCWKPGVGTIRISLSVWKVNKNWIYLIALLQCHKGFSTMSDTDCLIWHQTPVKCLVQQCLLVAISTNCRSGHNDGGSPDAVVELRKVTCVKSAFIHIFLNKCTFTVSVSPYFQVLMQVMIKLMFDNNLKKAIVLQWCISWCWFPMFSVKITHYAYRHVKYTHICIG